MLFSYVLLVCFFCVGQVILGIPRGTLEPKENNVLEGGVAEFTCTVTGRDTANEEIWWQAANDQVLWRYSATSEKIIFGDSSLYEDLQFEDHYNTSTEAEVFILRINNVTRSFNQYKYGCIYKSSTKNAFLDDSATLFVWTKPTSQPQCNYSGDIPTIISGDKNYPIDLTCSIEGGNPPPLLTWYQKNQNYLSRISVSGSYYRVNAAVSISTSDHGKEYICQATIDAIPNEPLTCQIIPYNSMPKIDITSEKQIYQSGESILVICNNTGVSTVDTSYLWYIDGILNAPSHDGITIKNTMKSSTIFISNYPFSSDTIEVTCVGIIPNVASANASLHLAVSQTNDQTTTEPITTIQFPSGQADSTLVTIIAAAAGGSFVTTLIAITAFCVYLKCKKSSKEVEKDRVETISMEVNATSEPGTSNGTLNPNHSPILNTNYEELNKDRIPAHVYQELSADNKDAKRKHVSEPGTSNETSNPDHNQTLNTNYAELNKDQIPTHVYQELSADNKDAKRHMYQTHIVDTNAAGLTFNPEVESPAGPNDDYEVPVNI